MNRAGQRGEAKNGLRVADFDFDLPPELIAQQPPVERGESRMLAMDRATGALRDMTFAEFPSLLKPGDLLVLNETRVIPARLYARRAASAISPAPAAPQMLGAPSLRLFSGARVGTHESRPVSAQQQPSARIEVLLTEPAGENFWRALVRPGRKVAIGERLLFPAPSGEIALEAEVLERGEFGDRLLRFEPVADFFAVLDRIGHVPLPPYIRRADADADREHYQTVFAREPGSVAAPTAGLHFTPPVLEALAARGVEVARITLHVGLGTFAPLRVETLDEVRLHRERYTLSAAAADAVNRAMSEGRRIVAVGTTVVRTLEAAAAAAEKRRITDEICERHPSGPKGPVDFAGSMRGLKPPPPSESSLSAACLAGGGTVLTASGLLQPHSGETEIFISPGFEFRVVGALLTNFHLPQSSLLMLVSAFAGREPVLAAYAHAVRERYRFFSYGDCMYLA
jgi:S-adenosylmethionine:tRNA ribosyltransferase-isomerase